MNQIDLNDPRLTAYALNEMEPAERAEFEQALAQDAAARQAVAEISATVVAVAGALEQEPLEPTVLSPDNALQRAAIIPGGDLRKLDGGPLKQTFKLIRFPQLYYAISGLAAACFAMFFVYWQHNEMRPAQRQYIQIPVAAASEKAENSPAEASPPPEATVAAVELTSRDESEARMLMITDRIEALKQEARAPAVPVPTTLKGQSPAPAPAVAGRLDEAEEKVVLGPFAVVASADTGYAASSTLAGARVRTGLSDLAYRNASGGKLQPAADGVWGLSRAARESNTEGYGFRKDNDYLRAADNPLSTFSVDVDTASYANLRRFLTQGQRPPADAVRIEELVNYFPYDYRPPTDNVPFSANLEVAGAPWAPAHRLVRIGLKGREQSDAARPAANLVFLLDVSGSMNETNKLPLVKQSLRLLVEKLRPDDRVAIAVYAGASGLALPSTSAAHRAEIMDAIDRLQAEGSTNGAMGIQLAYDIAKANFIPGGVNRVILATDGDFNVGLTSEGDLVRLVGEKAKSGVFLTVLGFGMGNLKDNTLEQLADKGNGNYAYIDSLAEARKSLVEQAGGTLVTIAKDVKIQVEFNPAVVQAYRLIGYENRLLAKEEFNNDQVDAGEVGAGHTVTALYEVVLVGAEMPGTGTVDALKYQVPDSRGQKSGDRAQNGEMLTVKIRYKEPAGDVSSKLEFPLRDAGVAFASASRDFKFAMAVAAFGMVLRDSPHKGTSTLGDVITWARDGLGGDAGGYRNEFVGLVERTQRMVQ